MTSPKPRRLPRLVLAACAIFGGGPSAACAGIFGPFGSAKPPAQSAAPTKAAASAPTAAVKAGPDQRAAADRLDPLARASFWEHEAQVDPTDAEAGVRLAISLRALQRYPEAQEAAQKVLVLHPTNEDARLERARAFLGADQGFYAIDDLQAAIAAAPRDWRPLSLLGVAYNQTKRPQEARQAWDQALALSPNNPAVLSNIALADALAGKRAEAESLLRRAAAAPNASAQERQNLALVLGLEGKMAEAESLIRRDLPPETADANLDYLHAIAASR